VLIIGRALRMSGGREDGARRSSFFKTESQLAM